MSIWLPLIVPYPQQKPIVFKDQAKLCHLYLMDMTCMYLAIVISRGILNLTMISDHHQMFTLSSPQSALKIYAHELEVSTMISSCRLLPVSSQQSRINGKQKVLVFAHVPCPPKSIIDGGIEIFDVSAYTLKLCSLLRRKKKKRRNVTMHSAYQYRIYLPPEKILENKNCI